MKEENKNPAIVHFEIPADDVDRARKFYSTLFGWKIEKFEGSMEYWMISQTGDSSDKSLAGGLMKRQNPQQSILNYVGVPSIDEYSKRINELGGKIIVPKTEIGGYGSFAVSMDTENNTFAIWEAKQQQQQEKS
jgi:predicted enzyme related to lactoylglutathione lyase